MCKQFDGNLFVSTSTASSVEQTQKLKKKERKTFSKPLQKEDQRMLNSTDTDKNPVSYINKYKRRLGS
jgi:hypothetical protein